MEATKTLTAETLATMGKEELRQACRDLGVSYSKLNNDGMRKLLLDTIVPAKQEQAEEVVEQTPAPSPMMGSLIAQLSGMTPAAPTVASCNVTKVRDGKKIGGTKPTSQPTAPAAKEEEKPQGYNHTGIHKCPECGSLEDQTWANEGVSLFCHHCETTYSATTGRKIRAGHSRPNASKGYTIQKDRPEQNGVKRPSEGTVCGQVWAEFDKNPEIRAKDLGALADAHGWNRNNVSCEFYAWRKFNGIKGRQ